MALTFDHSLKLPDDQYFHTGGEKSGICIHHTVGGSAVSTYNWWLSDNAMVGTAYLIARNGTVHEIFDPKNWAWQFGLNWDKEEKIKFEKRFIGIELASEGGLIEHSGKLYCFDRISERTLKKKTDAFDYGKIYRGYRYFDKYETAQVNLLIELINHLCDKFSIKRRVPANYLEYYGKTLKDFKGVIGHVNVRKDKSDPVPNVKFWEKVISKCSLKEIKKISSASASNAPLTDLQIDELFDHNVLEINKMNISAGSMVKGLIMELERDNRNTYIKLHDAEAGGHKVKYDFIEGDRGLVFSLANALGFKTVTDNQLEVHSA